MNPHWSDEVLFQEARRVVIAEIQHITYHEYLPVVLGQSVVSDYGLQARPFGFSNGYDINTNVGVLSAVGSAALWFFASLMPKTMGLYDTVRSYELLKKHASQIKLTEAYFLCAYFQPIIYKLTISSNEMDIIYCMCVELEEVCREKHF